MKRYWFGLAGLAGLAVGMRYALRQRPLDVRGRVVIVSGASSGIGRATAHAFAARGARVVLAARRADRLAAVQAELAVYGVPTLVVPADLGRESDLAALVEQTLAAFGRIDVLVCNAGLDLGGLHGEVDPARLRVLVEVNFTATARLVQLVVPVLRAQGRGQIVIVGSGEAVSPVPGQAAYATSKAALAGFAAALRRELDDDGLRVSLVLPSLTRTPMIAAADEAVLRRLGIGIDEPETPAAAIVDAVRFGRRDVILGGPGLIAATWLERFAPGLMDLYWRWMLTPELIDALSRFGQEPDAS